jgi:hypothetical protein
MLLFFGYDLFNIPSLLNVIHTPILLHLVLVIASTLLIYFLPESLKSITFRFLLFIFFITLQFVGLRLFDAFFCLILWGWIYLLSPNSYLKSWISTILFAFWGIMFLPFSPHLFHVIQSYIETKTYTDLFLASVLISFILNLLYIQFYIKKQPFFQKISVFVFSFIVISVSTFSLKFLNENTKNKKNSTAYSFTSNVADRVSNLDKNLTQSARISMWKSAVPWIKDYPFIGTGLDTIKYMYPIYRRVDYGKLEGGHNYTPDRLHNEYLNTLATKGILGFIAYYGGFVFLWFLIVVIADFYAKRKNSSYLIMGCATGAGVYLVQVLFNFGVVATLFLFYALVGISIAIAKSPEEFSL